MLLLRNATVKDATKRHKRFEGNNQMRTIRTTRSTLLALALLTPVWLMAQPMHTAGLLEVTDAGGANYTIPLALPPGTGTNDPKLSLIYNSHSSNGLFGAGWSLSGISSITRCAKNPAEEGVRDSVKNTTADLYCLDGQKLRVVSGIYGANGAQYRAAKDSYARITSYGTAGNGPQWFKVELKNGQIMEFGNTADARLELPSSATVRVWMLSATKDRSASGNPITYSYLKNLTLGEQVLSAVQYNNGYVSLEYEARPTDDAILKYDNGVQLGSTHQRVKTMRLHSEPLVGGVPTRQLFKEYRLSYTQSGATRRSLLTGLQECGPGGTTAACFPPVQFNYHNTSLAAVTPSVRQGAPLGMTQAIHLAGNGIPRLVMLSESMTPQHLATQIPMNPVPSWSFDDVLYLNMLDVNGDGKTDMAVTFRGPGTATFVHYLYISNGTTLVGQHVNTDYLTFGKMSGGGCTGDFKGDGIWHGVVGVCRSIDMNGDGRSEAVFTLGSGSHVKVTNTFVDYLLPLPAIEDPDFYYAADDPLYRGEFGRVSVGSIPAVALFPANNPMFGDFNGDGNTDMIETGHNLGQIIYSSGTQYFRMSAPGLYHSFYGGCVADFNGDGRSDAFDATTSLLYLSTSNGFSGVPITRLRWGDAIVCADLNGDGRADIYSALDGAILSAPAVGPADALSQVDLGAGSQVRLEYKPLTDASVYTKGTGAVYPKSDVQNATYVVSRTLSSDGRGGFVPVAYTYEALRTDLQRNGTLGFEKITNRNELTGVGLRTTYRQDPPFTGLRASTQKFHGTQTLEQTDYTYQAFNQTALYARVHQVGATTRVHDLNGAFIRWVRETTPAANIDAYGNPGLQTIEHLDAAGTTVVSRQTLTHSYTNDTINWLVGLTTGTTTQSQVPSTAIPAAAGTDPLATRQNH